MLEKDLDTEFEKAVAIANTMSQQELPQDIQLLLYASYKQANINKVVSQNVPSFDLRSAFKMNALMQVSHLTQNEAKKMYIELIEKIIKNNTNEKI